MKTVMTYCAVEDFLPPAQQHGAVHVVLMVGTFDEPMNGDVADWTLRPWNEVLQPWQLG